MTLQFWVDGVEQGNVAIRLTEGIQGLAASAHGGEVSFAGVIIEDPDGTRDYTAWKSAWFLETACTGRTRIWTGFVAGRQISRGRYRNGAGRIWDLTLVDQNAVFKLNPITGNDWNRPAETDIVRLNALHGSIYLPSSLIADSGKADFTNDPVSFGDADYRHQYPLDVFTSVAGTSGKDFYAYYDHTASATSLFYDLNATTLSTSTLRISNVAADVDGTTTFAPLKDAVLTRSGEDVYSNIDFQYRGGFVVDSDPATATAFIQRGAIYSTDRVGRRETAVTLAQAFLDAHDAETDEIAVSVRLPKEKVNFIEQGMGLDVKFSHLPGYTSFTTIKLISRNVVQYDDEWYDLHLVGSSKPLISGPGGGDPGEFPLNPCDEILLVQSKAQNNLTCAASTTTLDSTPVPGNVLVAWVTMSQATNTHAPTGFTAVDSYLVIEDDSHPARLYYRIVQDGDSATINWTGAGAFANRTIVAEFSGANTFDTFDSNTEGTDIFFPSPTTMLAGTVTPTVGASVLLVGGVGAGPGNTDTGSGQAGNDGAIIVDFAETGNGAPWSMFLYRTVETATGSYDLSGVATFTGVNRGIAGTVAAFTCTGSDQPPYPGQDVHRETPTPAPGGGNTVFFTQHPYADGSLRVWVDQVEQTEAMTESNPETGEFTLDFDPRSWEFIYCSYQGR